MYISGERQITAELLRTRILCMILLRPKGENRMDAIRLTWGKRCAILVFLLGGNVLNVTKLDARTSVVNLPIEDTYDTTWIKVTMQ